jgi:hypothetical protein
VKGCLTEVPEESKEVLTIAETLSMAISLAHPDCPFLVQDKGRRVKDWEKSWTGAVALAGADEALIP